MNAKAKHTPLPWIVDRRGRMVISGNGEPVASLKGLTEGGRREANYRLIVTAVNHHEEMVALLREMAANLGDRTHSLASEARALLAKIEKED